MREALARADSDFVLSEGPRSRARKSPAKSTSLAARVLRAFSFLLRRPGRAMVLVLAVGLTVAVLGNALFMQKGRHPAPLFVTPTSETAPQRVTPRVATPPAPVPRPVELAARSDGKPEATPAQPAKSAAAKPPADADPIGSLLRGGAQPGAVAADPAAAKRVAAVQRALQKLAYDVVPDGVFGAGTKAALQKFERERNMPVTGELDPKTLRALAARSGVPIP